MKKIHSIKKNPRKFLEEIKIKDKVQLIFSNSIKKKKPNAMNGIYEFMGIHSFLSVNKNEKEESIVLKKKRKEKINEQWCDVSYDVEISIEGIDVSNVIGNNLYLYSLIKIQDKDMADKLIVTLKKI